MVTQGPAGNFRPTGRCGGALPTLQLYLLPWPSTDPALGQGHLLLGQQNEVLSGASTGRAPSLKSTWGTGRRSAGRTGRHTTGQGTYVLHLVVSS